MTSKKTQRGLSDAELKAKYGTVENKVFGKTIVEIAKNQYKQVETPKSSTQRGK